MMLVWVVKVCPTSEMNSTCLVTMPHLILYTEPCTTGQLRLAGGNIQNEGRVEICISNLWGTICDDFWGSADAIVVCRQLGYSMQGCECS